MSLAPEECSDDRPPSAEGPGVELRLAREAHQLTLEDLARATKIRTTILAAIETSDVARLPAAIYTRGFVKAYAREVGMDPERTADEYLRMIAPLAAQAPVDDTGHRPAVARTADAPMHGGGEPAGLSIDNSMGQFGWVTTVVAVVGLIAYLGYLGSIDDNSRQEAPVAGLEQATPSDAALARQDDRLAPDATRAVEGPLRLELRTQGPCWLVITVDGEPVLARLLQPGEYHAFDVDEEAVLRVGDPGALTLAINGQAGRPLGPPGEPVDIRITKADFREFLGGRSDVANRQD